jgi:hypothetical protein
MRVVDKKKIIGKMVGQGGGEDQGFAAPPPQKKERVYHFIYAPYQKDGSEFRIRYKCRNEMTSR